MLSSRQLFLQHLAQTSDAPLALEIDRAEGIYMYGPTGKSYIDLISGISVSNLGHRHPKVMAAIAAQSERYLHTLVYGEFILSPQVQLAKYLADLLPTSLSSCYFVNSGTEATEGAMKLAKRYTGRAEIIACETSYHGSSQGALSLMSTDFFTAPFRPLLPNINHIAFNSWPDLDKITEKTAAVIIEPVRAEKGVENPLEGYLKALRARCTAVGALLIFDEIQVGCGRTGSFFAFEQFDVVPDILLLAKGFGGGMPIGAFIASQEIMQVLSHNPFLGHITTFGGHPLCCAAALANLKVLKEEYEELIGTVKEKEALFLSLLKHPKIKTVRSAGLLMAVQLSSYEQTKAVILKCMEKGLISDWFLFNDSAIRIAPPLIISPQQIHQAVAILLEAIDEVDGPSYDKNN
ncbi:ornithine/acetylornithine aminotransferase [Saprospira grandis DSM 2844]|uniref:Ornithine/acetylornithine aminotransferase n=1 Tax=Saprospira grandis DSM 2844 TaxID=694433 RepID=J0P0E4_9BACT|nr:aspartate aminotransferase family protein [Saprospira grandis]EJF53244.1 ornithine/acetylornithine aminotransferase [Saprospira grandis DSM 2844]